MTSDAVTFAETLRGLTVREAVRRLRDAYPSLSVAQAIAAVFMAQAEPARTLAELFDDFTT